MKLLTFGLSHALEHLIEDVEGPLIRILVGDSGFFQQIPLNIRTDRR